MKAVLVTPDAKRDYTTELVVEGLKEMGVQIFASARGNGIEVSSSEEDLIKEAVDSDVVLGFFGKVRDNKPPKNWLLPRLGHLSKRAFVDGSEWTYTGHPLPGQVERSLLDPALRRSEPWIDNGVMKHVSHYFKRETYPVDVASGIKPLPFGLSKRHILPEVEKDIDVFCVFGQVQTGLRREVLQCCKELAGSGGLNIVAAMGVDPASYRDMVARSRIVVDAWGGGDNCDRFYEAIGARACCLYQRYNVVVQNPYVDFETAVSYSTINEFRDRVRELLHDPRRTTTIGQMGYEHALKFHTAVHRAKFIIDTVCG